MIQKQFYFEFSKNIPNYTFSNSILIKHSKSKFRIEIRNAVRETMSASTWVSGRVLNTTLGLLFVFFIDCLELVQNCCFQKKNFKLFEEKLENHFEKT